MCVWTGDDVCAGWIMCVEGVCVCMWMGDVCVGGDVMCEERYMCFMMLTWNGGSI